MLIPFPLSGQETYFHELKGMEDSEGTTHLFYRMYQSALGCSFYKVFRNHIYHLNTSSNTDSLLISDGSSTMQYFDECYYSSNEVIEYEFVDEHPEKYIFSGVGVQLDPSFYVGNSFGNYIETGFSKVADIEIDNSSDSVFLSFDTYYEDVSTHYRIPTFGAFWEYKEYFDIELFESFKITYSVSDINPYQKGNYFTIDYESGHLLRSTDYGKSFELVDSSITDWRTMSELLFDSTSQNLYSVSLNPDSSYLFVKSDNKGKQESWSIQKRSSDEMFLSVNTTNGQLFLSSYDSVFSSANQGITFELLSLFDSKIKGLYKKPGSDILYVLTKNELLEVNTLTLETFSLKKLPVSNEQPRETPSSITLHQNYPNPFNPTTIISFELDKPSKVTLTVFDALGRTLSILINEQRSTGIHKISYDASNLSSGIYFYRLEAGEFSQTKRLTLIK